MSDPVLDAVHARVLKMNNTHRPFALPILRAIHRLGGSARKSAVMAELRLILGPQLAPDLFDELARRGRFGWARFELKSLDLLGGPDGTWALTDLGTRYVEAHKDDPTLIAPIVLAPRDQPAKPVDTTPATVPVTGFRAYAVPLLEALQAGHTKTRDIVDAVGKAIGAMLLPGDHGTMPSGPIVWRFRANWGLSSLGKEGDAVNVQSGMWQITDAGRQRLQRERPGWDLTQFPTASATIVVDPEGTMASPAASGLPEASPLAAIATPEQRWARLRESLPEDVVDVLAHRLRPDLGPTPPIGPFARNVILYGPPGTGKTHVAKLVAQALTGDDDADHEGRSQLVQFHPSYAYEDFVQGLRPDVTRTELLYALKRGPFLRIVEAADNDAEHFHVLVIDEINRGDPARIFGELLYALEYRDEAVTLAGGGALSVPSNLVIIGTMNSVDRSVALVDYALRRRFGFVRLDPDASVIGQVHGDTMLGNAGGMVLERFNDWLTVRLSRDHAIGHSYFLSRSLDPSSATSFDRLWELDVKPLLEEYFFGDRDALQEAEARWRAIVVEGINEASDDRP